MKYSEIAICIQNKMRIEVSVLKTFPTKINDFRIENENKIDQSFGAPSIGIFFIYFFVLIVNISNDAS